ncbi:unnamed protein product [Caenorhabditis brenneri]
MDFWSKLPENFQRSVIKKLDYKSRCRFRKCSKRDLSLVDSCPVFLDRVDIQPRPGNLMYFGIGEYENCEELLCDKDCEMEDTIQDFLLIFKNSNSKLKMLDITHHNYRLHPEALNVYIPSLLYSMRSTTYRLKIEELNIGNYSEMVDINFLNLLKFIDPCTLKCLSLRKFPTQNPDLWREIVETEQWKNLKVIQIPEKTTVKLDYFIHADRFCIYIDSLSAEDCWRCIQKYLDKPFPLHSFFQVFTSQELVMDEILAKFNVRPRDDPVERNNPPDDYIHTQRFSLPWFPEYIFYVEFYTNRVEGAICRKQFLLNDLEELQQ